MRLVMISLGLATMCAAAAADEAVSPTDDGLCPQAMTQTDLNLCARQMAIDAETELNAVYRQVISEYSADPTFIDAFVAAQRAWLAYRDAELKARFPHRSSRVYGSVLPMCTSLVGERLTRQRIAHLRQWLTGIPEGDVCAGSVRMK